MSEKNQIMINEYPSYDKVLQIVIEQKLPFNNPLFCDGCLNAYSFCIHQDVKRIWDNLHDIDKIKENANIMCSYFENKKNAFSQLQKCFYIILAVMRHYIKGMEDEFRDDWFEIKCNLNKGFEGVCGWAN